MGLPPLAVTDFSPNGGASRKNIGHAKLKYAIKFPNFKNTFFLPKRIPRFINKASGFYKVFSPAY
jgi:hypothetical protein